MLRHSERDSSLSNMYKDFTYKISWTQLINLKHESKITTKTDKKIPMKPRSRREKKELKRIFRSFILCGRRFLGTQQHSEICLWMKFIIGVAKQIVQHLTTKFKNLKKRNY